MLRGAVCRKKAFLFGCQTEARSFSELYKQWLYWRTGPSNYVYNHGVILTQEGSRSYTNIDCIGVQVLQTTCTTMGSSWRRKDLGGIQTLIVFAYISSNLVNNSGVILTQEGFRECTKIDCINVHFFTPRAQPWCSSWRRKDLGSVQTLIVLAYSSSIEDGGWQNVVDIYVQILYYSFRIGSVPERDSERSEESIFLFFLRIAVIPKS